MTRPGARCTTVGPARPRRRHRWPGERPSRHAGRPRGRPRRFRHSRSCPTCRHCTPGWSATSVTTWCARSSTCPTSRPTTSATPTPCLSVIGQLAAFDHWRQRVVLIENVVIDPDDDEAALRRRLSAGRGPSRRAGGRLPRHRPASRRDPCPSPRGLPDDVVRTMSDGLYEDAVRAAKEHITAGDIFQVVLSQRFDLPTLGVDPFDVYRVLRLVNPSPYLYFLRFDGITVVGCLARADGPPARRHRHLPAHRRLTAPGLDAGGRRPLRRGSWSRTRRSWPST